MEDEKIEIKEQLDKAKATLILKQTEGGKNIIDKLKADVYGLIQSLRNKYREIDTVQLLSIIALIDAKYTLIEEFDSLEERIDILTNELKEKE